ncbi:MAG: ATP-binding protein [Rectinemataceae bacterium]|nr:ATP-binding protein [Rectinemataceae bacterium]
MHYALCDFVLDIVQNGIEAGSSLVRLDFDESEGWYSVTVTDNGKGMTERERVKALDPFYTDGVKHAKRKVGLGLPFLVQAVEQAGGDFSLESEKGSGTKVAFRFPKDNVDCPPMGDLPGLFQAVLSFSGDHEVEITRRKPGNKAGYEVARSELAEAIGDLERVSSLVMLRDFLSSQEDE